MDPADKPPATRAAQIRRRLLERVADGDDSHVTIEADVGAWQPFLEGVEVKVLREHEGVLSYLLRMAPGASLPPHRHPLDEECVVLEGTLRVGAHLEIGRGAYHLAHRGALHGTVSAPSGALLFLRGAVPARDQVLG